MSKRQIGRWVFGGGTLVMIAVAIVHAMTGNGNAGRDVLSVGILLSLYLTTTTWGTKGRADGIVREEELGKKITEESSKVSYRILTLFIFLALLADVQLHEEANLFLLLLLATSFVVLPLTQWLYIRKYE